MGTNQSSMNPTHRTPPSSANPLEKDSSSRISDEIEDTRSRMDETLDELGERLSPRRIIDDVVDYFTGPSKNTGASIGVAVNRLSDSAGEFGRNLSRTVRDNPVPTALIGAGLAWLAFGLGQNDSDKVDRPRRRRQLNRDRYFADEYDEYDDNNDNDGTYIAEGDYLLESRYEEDQHDSRDPKLVLPESYAGGSKSSEDPSMWDNAKQAAAGAVDSVSGAASSAGQAISGAASTAGSAIGDAASAAVSGVSSAASSVASGASSAAGATSDAASSAFRRSRRAGQDAYRYAASSRRSVARGISRQSQNMSDSVSDLAGQVSDKYQQASQQYPLAIGAGCMALGMLAGLVIPRTRREDKWMGETADSLKQDAREAGEQLVARGQQVVSETMDKASASAEQHGLTGDSLLDRGKRVVSKVVDAASEALNEEDLTADKLAGDIKSVGNDVAGKAKDEAEKAAADVKSMAASVDSDVKKL